LQHHSYNRYLAVAARVVRRSLKEEKRIAAERRGQQELRFAKWSVSGTWTQEARIWEKGTPELMLAMRIQNGKQGEIQNLADANAQAAVESAATGGH
jgi:hypothetical protein